MAQTFCLSPLSKATSNAIFNPSGTIIPSFRTDFLEFQFQFDNASNIRSRALFPYYAQIKAKNSILDALIIPQSDGSFVARAETEDFCANGQGENEEKVLRNLTEAVELLLEEKDHPSGNVPWPNDYR